MNKTRFFNIATIVVPVICLLLVVFLTVTQVRRIGRLDRERVATEQSVATLDRLLQEQEEAAPLEKQPTVAQTPQEQPEFLDRLRGLAAASDVRIVRWANQAPAAEPKEGEGTGLPAGVTAIASSLEVTGTYEKVRVFLYGLQNDPRLYSLSDVKWSRSGEWPRTSVSLIVTRYVAPAPAARTADAGG